MTLCFTINQLTQTTFYQSRFSYLNASDVLLYTATNSTNILMHNPKNAPNAKDIKYYSHFSQLPFQPLTDDDDACET